MLALILLAEEQPVSNVVTYRICEIIVSCTTDHGSMVDLLQVVATLLEPSELHQQMMPLDHKNGAPSKGIVALVRSTQGDTKIILPPVDFLAGLSSTLLAIYSSLHANSGQLPVLRGDYAIWDNIFAQALNSAHVSER